jgi:hypothetical protein
VGGAGAPGEPRADASPFRSPPRRHRRSSAGRSPSLRDSGEREG